MYLSGSTIEGLRLIEEIRKKHPQTATLVCTVQEPALYAERSMQLGAAGFVSKCEPLNQVTEAIRNVLDGHPYLSERTRVETYGSASERASETAIHRLSPRELEIFELVGQGRSPHDIAKRLSIGLKTVDAHRQNIRRKLGLANMGDLIRNAALWAAKSN